MQYKECSIDNLESYKNIIYEFIQLDKNKDFNKNIQRILRRYPDPKGGLFSKSEILNSYEVFGGTEIRLTDIEEEKFFRAVRLKRTRTISGVTPVTVLTKPFPCPGKCIFCPNDIRMPKSYLSDEPGAQRALRNRFDPYLQTHNRLTAFKKIGHSTDKVELIILGGTWSSYPKDYQIWFVKRCFDAMNEFHENPTEAEVDVKMPFIESEIKEIDGSQVDKNFNYNKVISKALDRQKQSNEKSTKHELKQAHEINENAKTRCVGLVIETRPDEITIEEAKHIRELGATKVQIGYQSLNDEVLRLNKRGHGVAQIIKATKILRSFGFKIHVHYMPNLYGSTPKMDVEDYKKLFDDINFRPDEIKIYPCSLVASAELMQIYEKGGWSPYSQQELLDVLTECYEYTPEYCRITRMIRDICSQDIVVGNKMTNFREVVENNIKDQDIQTKEIRSREIREDKINFEELELKIVEYQTSTSTEHFLQYVTSESKIAGFLRLSIPVKTKGIVHELNDCAIIREIHVYGEVIDIGNRKDSKAQHLGIGKTLIKHSEQIAKTSGFSKLAVISSIGTVKYYEKNGFVKEGLYQHKKI